MPALDKPSDLCVATLNTFVAILGAEVGNMALKVMSTGGVYLGGGIPPRIMAFLEGGTFMNAFLDKGRFVELLADVPINVILNPRCALLGSSFLWVANVIVITRGKHDYVAKGHYF